MPQIGDSGSIEFPVPPREPGRRRTVFLHGRGYYKLHMEKSDRSPDRERLKEIMERPGGAVRFAAECLERIQSGASNR